MSTAGSGRGDSAPDDEAFRAALGRAIAARRSELGLKRNDLRDRSSLSYPYVAELETGAKRPSQAALAAIAEALELRPSELLERAEAILHGEQMRPVSRQPSWFHSPPMAAAMPASARPQQARPSDDDLEAVIERVVRRVVRDELRRAGVEPAPPRRSRRKP